MASGCYKATKNSQLRGNWNLFRCVYSINPEVFRVQNRDPGKTHAYFAPSTNKDQRLALKVLHASTVQLETPGQVAEGTAEGALAYVVVGYMVPLS